MAGEAGKYYGLYTDLVIQQSREEQRRYNGTLPSGGHKYRLDKWIERSASWPQAQIVEKMKLAKANLRSDPVNPEYITNYRRLLWSERGNILEKNFEIPDIDRGRVELTELRNEGRKIIYRPKDMDWMMLDKLAPRLRLGKYAKLLSRLEDSSEGVQYGWIDVENNLGIPNNFRTEKDVIDEFRVMGRAPMDFTTFGIDLIDSFDFDRSVLSKKWTRLPGSRFRGRSISVLSDSDGGLNIYSLISPDFKDINLGALSKGGKRK